MTQSRIPGTPSPSPSPGTPISTPLAVVGVSKSYGGTVVLSEVDLELRPREIHALCGENGAGKSTLVKILAGVVSPETGTVLLDGEPVVFSGPTQARDLGIAVIHQHPVLFPDLSIAENIALVDRRSQGRFWMRQRQVKMAATEILQALDLDLNPGRNASTLAIADQQMVEIAKALVQSPKVLVLDEPTASLTPHEVDRLFQILSNLRDQGVALLIVNHRMPEVFAMSDRITVLRNGVRIATTPTTEVTSGAIVQQMVGHEVRLGGDGGTATGDVALRTENLTRNGVFRDINLNVRAGEIVGLAGLIGAGRTEIARAIFGIDKIDGGRVEVAGRPLTTRSPGRAMAAGVAFVPEDRHGQGLAMDGSIAENAVVTSFDRVSSRGWMSRRKEAAFTRSLIERLHVACRGPEQLVSDLSGGNQQKVVLGRWLATAPKVLILDEPTFGVDIGAQQEIHELIRSLARSGVAVLLISSDLLELLALSMRVLVVREGEVVADLSGSELTEVEVMSAAVGSDAT